MIEKKETKLPELIIDDGALEEFIGSDRYYKWKDKRRKQIETSRAKQAGMDSYYHSIAKTLSGEYRDKNLVYSPLNIYMALSVLTELTAGETKEHILKAL